MKKGFGIIALCIAMVFLLTGCQSMAKDFMEGLKEGITGNESRQASIDEGWATYTIPTGWAEEVENSYDGIRYFSRNNVALPEYYSYISMEYVETEFSKKEYKECATSLVDAMYEEYQDYNVEVTGFTTGSEYLVIVAKLESLGEEHFLQKQYFIIGDRMCAVLTSCDYFNENITDVSETANAIIESFQWTETNDDTI